MSEIFSGNTITIENLGNSKAKLNKISGSWQETRSGINKFDISKAKRACGACSLQNNGDSIDVIATNTEQYTSANIDITDLFKEGETIYAMADFVASGSNTGAYRIQWAEDIGLTKGDLILMSSTSGTVKSGVIPTKPEGATKLLLYLYGNVTDTVAIGDTVRYSKIMLSNQPITDYEPYGAMPSPEFRSEIRNVTGSAKITVCNKNMLYNDWAKDFVNRINNNAYSSIAEINGKKFLFFSAAAGYVAGQDFKDRRQYFIKAPFKENTQYTFSSKIMLSTERKETNIAMRYTDGTIGYIFLSEKAKAMEEFDFSLTSRADKTLYSIEVDYQTGQTYIDLSTATLKEGTSKEYIKNETQQFTFPLAEGQRMYKDSYLAHDGVHHKRGRYYLKNANFMLSANHENNSVFQASNPSGLKFVDETSLCNIATYEYLESASIKMNKIYTFMINDKSYIRMSTADKTREEFLSMIEQTDAYIEHKLAEEIIEPYTAEQENVYMQLQNMELYEGINHIFIEGEHYAEIEVAVTKLIEDYDSYISSNGRLIVPGSNINYLVDLSESDIPTMPEAVESSVRVAGRDGDVPLKTTYEPMSYSIVCYTEDNLSLLEKVEEEKKINKLLNSIKDKTMTFALEKSNKFYNVKYSGALTTINYPKHLKFSIPLKASDSYGKDLIKKSIVGNSIGESETAEKVGALFILRGPATNPIIALNDYSMEYGMAILEGARVEIDSNKSTITHINSSGIKTNVMKYYNHQFPKIENGINELKILSGFDSDMQVSVIWNDLKL